MYFGAYLKITVQTFWYQDWPAGSAFLKCLHDYESNLSCHSTKHLYTGDKVSCITKKSGGGGLVLKSQLSE